MEVHDFGRERLACHLWGSEDNRQKTMYEVLLLCIYIL
jgi:hypothetical protein